MSGDDIQTVIASGQRVIQVEREALAELEAGLGETFAEAVERCSRVSGRIVLAGVGKSGHVARKIAATLASTGTPSLYIHPTEASHGDLGMITGQDVVIALSRSGETKELSDLIAYCTRFSIPLIGMTAVPTSLLGRASTLCLAIPDAPEACAETRAPTTSTTLSMALGDALAVAILERRGFTADDFKIYHPGGKLGAMLRTVGELMHGGIELPWVARGAPLNTALSVMSDAGYGCLAVVADSGAGLFAKRAPASPLIGMVTDGDIRRLVTSGASVDTIDLVMTPDPVTVQSDTSASQALAIMNERRITQLFVVDEANIPVGVLHMHDLLKAGLA